MTAASVTAAPVAPTQAWILAWASLAGQVLTLLDRGTKTELDLPAVISMALGGLVIGFVSAGVLRARTVRLAIAWVVLALGACLYAFSVLDGSGDGWSVLQLGITIVQMAALASFSGTPYFAAVRRDRRLRPQLGGLLTIAIVVGALGGLVPPAGSDVSVSFDY